MVDGARGKSDIDLSGRHEILDEDIRGRSRHSEPGNKRDKLDDGRSRDGDGGDFVQHGRGGKRRNGAAGADVEDDRPDER